MASGSNLVFCVSPVLFECSGLILDSTCSLTPALIQRLRQDCPTSTTISFADWKEIATTTLGLRDSIATNIFDVFYALSVTKPEQRQEHNRVLLGKMGGVVDETKWPGVSSARLVSLPGLTLFLMAQLVLDRPPRAPAGEAPSETILAFVKSQFHEILAMLAVTKQGRLSLQDIGELQLLLREFANGVEQPFGTSIGFLWPRSEKTVDVAVPVQFIRPRLVLPSEIRTPTAATHNTPFPNNILVRGLSSTVHIIQSTTSLMACNLISAPSPQQQVSGITHNPAVMKLASSTVRFSRCNQTMIFATSELPNTAITSMTNCSVTLGPVSGVLLVDRCENCQISALCSALVVSNCRNVVLYVCVNNPPIILNGNSDVLGGGSTLENVRIAPYNTHYSTLEEHLLSSGVNPKLNLWRCFVQAPLILRPDEFVPVSFPIAPQTVAVVTTRTNPVPLPKEYLDAVQAKVQRFSKLTGTLQTAYRQLESSGRKDLAEALRNKIQTMFLDWLYDAGQAKGLLDLLHQAPPVAGSGAAASC